LTKGLNLLRFSLRLFAKPLSFAASIPLQQRSTTKAKINRKERKGFAKSRKGKQMMHLRGLPVRLERSVIINRPLDI
jgi:hypothetical protein